MFYCLDKKCHVLVFREDDNIKMKKGIYMNKFNSAGLEEQL